MDKKAEPQLPPHTTKRHHPDDKKQQKTGIHSIPRCNKSIRQRLARCHSLYHEQRRHWIAHVENSQKIEQQSASATKYQIGQTREINIADSIRQGGVLPMWPNDGWRQQRNDQKESWTKAAEHTIMHRVPSMDEWRGTNRWKPQGSPNNYQYNIWCSNQIPHWIWNGKILKIGKIKESPPLYLGNNELEYVQTYTYLGETMNNKGTMDNHIKETKHKTEAAYHTILAIVSNKYYNNIETWNSMELLETCIQPIITYGGESWNINKKEPKTLNQIQENIIRRILMVPQSTPTDTLYIETGLLDISTITTKKTLNMGKRIHPKIPERLVAKIMDNQTKEGWKDITNKIKTEIIREQKQKP